LPDNIPEQGDMKGLPYCKYCYMKLTKGWKDFGCTNCGVKVSDDEVIWTKDD